MWPPHDVWLEPLRSQSGDQLVDPCAVLFRTAERIGHNGHAARPGRQGRTRGNGSWLRHQAGSGCQKKLAARPFRPPPNTRLACPVPANARKGQSVAVATTGASRTVTSRFVSSIHLFFPGTFNGHGCRPANFLPPAQRRTPLGARISLSPGRAILSCQTRPLAPRNHRGRRPGAGKTGRSDRVVKICFPKCLTLYFVLVRIATAGCLVVASVCP